MNHASSQRAARPVRVLIVESRAELGALWQRHLGRCGMQVARAGTQNKATDYISAHDVDIIILDLIIAGGSALVVADHAQLLQPDARVIFVTNTSFFSDGSIFTHAANARAFLTSATPPDDLVAMVEYYGRKGS